MLFEFSQAVEHAHSKAAFIPPLLASAKVERDADRVAVDALLDDRMNQHSINRDLWSMNVDG